MKRSTIPFVIFLQEKNHTFANTCPATVLAKPLCKPPSLTSLSQLARPMPKNKVSNLITDQEIAFARLVLFRNPVQQPTVAPPKPSVSSRIPAAYTKSKPTCTTPTSSSIGPPCSNSSSSRIPTCSTVRFAARSVPWRNSAG